MVARLARITIVVAILIFAVELLLNNVVFNSLYKMNESAGIPWHNPSHIGWVIVAIATLIGAFAFTYIFLHGYEGQGVREGLRFGFLAWLLMSVPEVFGYATSLNFGTRLTVAQTGSDLAALLIAGIAAGAMAGAAPMLRSATVGH